MKMKKRIIIAVSIMAAMGLYGCSASAPEQETTAETTIAEAAVNETETTTAAEETTASETASEEITTEDTTTEETTAVSETEAGEPSGEFRLSACVSSYDKAVPMKFTAVDMGSVPAADESAVNAAADVYKKSDMYAEVVEEAKRCFIYENGGFTRIEESGFLSEAYVDFLVSGSEELAFEPKLKESYHMKFDGANEGNVIIFEVPCSPDDVVWSGTGTYFVMVYVNSKGEATVLDNACQQIYDFSGIIAYADGTNHMYFNGGHNDSGSNCRIYSFTNDTPECKYAKNGWVELMTEESAIRSVYNMDMYSDMAIWDAELSEYVGLKAAKADADPRLFELLCEDEAIRRDIPDIKEKCDNGEVYILGGKYVSVGMGSYYKYENGCFVQNDKLIKEADEEYFSVIMNVDLNFAN